MITCFVPPQLQFANIFTEWKVTLQREGGAIIFETTSFTAPSTQLTVNHLLPATRYTVWVSVKAGSAEGPLSNGLQVTTQEGGEFGRKSCIARQTNLTPTRCEVSPDLVYTCLPLLPQLQALWLLLVHFLSLPPVWKYPGLLPLSLMEC